MSIKFESPAEAIAAVAAMVIAADGVASRAEHGAAFAHVKNLGAFHGYDEKRFTECLGDVTTRIFEALPLTDGGALTQQGVGELIGAIRPVLTADQRLAALRMAALIGGSDEMKPSESAVLAQLRRGLGGA